MMSSAQVKSRTQCMVVVVLALSLGAAVGCGEEPPQCPLGDCIRKPLVPEINGGFEDVSDLSDHIPGWDSNLWGWMVRRSPSSHGGVWAVEFLRSADNKAYTEATLFSHRFEVTPATEYAVALEAHNPSGPLLVEIAWFDNLGECLKADDGECAATRISMSELETSASYRTISGSSVVPPSHGRAYGDIHVTASLPPGGHAYVDDVSITPLTDGR